VIEARDRNGMAVILRDPRGQPMKRFVEGADRGQSTLLPDYLDDWIGESNPVRVVEVFVDALDLVEKNSTGSFPRRPDGPLPSFGTAEAQNLWLSQSYLTAIPACHLLLQSVLRSANEAH
jgi:hypothetical protein